MSNIIKIKRSTGNAAPANNLLAPGELAYVQGNLNKLFIGAPADTIGNVTPLLIGGKYFTDLLDVTPGTASVSKALVVDDNKDISGIGVFSANEVTLATKFTLGNLVLDNPTTGGVGIVGPTLGVNDPDANININPGADAGKITFYSGAYSFPSTDGTIGQVLTTNGAGTLSWQPAATSLSLNSNNGQGTIELLTETLSIVGSTGISTSIDGDKQFVLTLDNDLQALSDLSTTGMIVRTSAGNVATRTLSTASSSRITVSDGDGVSGNPTVDLAAVSDSGTGTFKKITVDSYGRVTGTADVAEADITGLVGNTFVNVAGATMTGNLLMSNNATVTGLPTPSNSSDAASKSYVDSVAQGLDVKPSVRAASTENITLSGTQTIDGVILAVGDRVLVKNQTSLEQNGIYIVSAGSWTRALDMTTGTQFSGAFTFIEEGTTLADTGWVCVADSPVTVGTSFVSFVQFTSQATFTASNGVTKVGNDFRLDSTVAGDGLGFNTGILNVNVANGIEINAGSVQLASSVAGNGLGFSTGVLSVNTGFGLEIDSDNVRVAETLAGDGLTLTDGVMDVVGTADRIAVTANSVDIASTYVGQSSITTLGTISSGTWQGNTIGVAYGGTGLTSVEATRILHATGTNTIGTDENFTFNGTSLSVGQVSINGTSRILSASDTVTLTTSSGNIVLNPADNVSVSSKKIINLADPENDQDAVTKFYYHNGELDGGTF